jgi:hypothetical protein
MSSRKLLSLFNQISFIPIQICSLRPEAEQLQVRQRLPNEKRTFASLQKLLPRHAHHFSSVATGCVANNDDDVDVNNVADRRHFSVVNVVVGDRKK